MTRRILKAVYTMNAAAGSFVSVRKSLSARPFGVSTGLPVQHELALGFGAGLAAPWPMVGAMWWADASARSVRKATRPLALQFFVGALAEEVTFRAIRGGIAPAARVVATLNIFIPLLLLLPLSRHVDSSARPTVLPPNDPPEG